MLPVESTKLTDLVQRELSGGAGINFIGNMLDRGSAPTEIREVLLTTAAQNMGFQLLYPRLRVIMSNPFGRAAKHNEQVLYGILPHTAPVLF